MERTPKLHVVHTIRIKGLGRTVAAAFLFQVIVNAGARALDRQTNLKENLEKWSKKFEDKDEVDYSKPEKYEGGDAQ